MSNESLEKALFDWRVIILAIVLVASLWQLKPDFNTGKVNLKLGFEMVGGAQAVLQPKEAVTPEVIEETLNRMRGRIDVYGVKGITVRPSQDLQGNSFIMVEAPGVSGDDIEALLAKQGKLEAKIGNTTIFLGTDTSIKVPDMRIGTVQGGYRYVIPLTINNIAAMKAFADETEKLSSMGEYLDKPLDLYIDGKLMNSLQIASDLKGKMIDNPVIEGGAQTEKEAIDKMNQLKAILQSGPLPIELQLMSINTISPRLGSDFVRQIIFASEMIALAILIFLYIYYRNTTITLTILVMSAINIALILGVSSMFNWQIDLPSIAGIIVSMGVGIDQQVIITDQVLRGEKGTEEEKSMIQRLREAGTIIIASFGTTLAAMVPLLFLGSLKGFAITSMIGEALSFFFTRPAYLKLLPALIEE